MFFPDALPAVIGCGGAQGNYAECILVEEAVSRPKPEPLSLAEAAAGPAVPVSAWEGL